MVTRMRRSAILAVILAAWLGASDASAQVFGTFSWRMEPYCNVITLTITQFPAGYTLDGNDNQCATGKLASATGQALINPDGTVGLDFTIITSPGGKDVHVAALISPANGSGTWTDSVGNIGAFLLGAPGAGSPRPLPASGLGVAVITSTEIASGAVGASDINAAEVQARVTGTCPAGQAVTGVNANGTVTCAVTGSNVQFHVQGHSTQSIPNSVMTTITGWSNVLYNDGGGNYAAGVYTIPVTGLYSVTATPYWTGGFAAGQLGLDVTRNASRIGIVWGNADINATAAILPTVTTVAKFNAGDAVQIRVFQSSGGARPLNTTGGDANFMVTLIR